MTPTEITIYTDGSCLKNPGGPGGWGAVINTPSKQILASGCEPDTTNNRMEMIAALSAVRLAKKVSGKIKITLYTDSQYVQNGMMSWLAGWKRRGWVSSTGSAVLNRDLWEELDRECADLAIDWKWVRGHNGNPNNELANTLAQTAARRQQGSYQEISPEDIQQCETENVSTKRRSIVTLELDLKCSDEKIGEQIRIALIASRGKSIRIRETEK